MPVADEHMKPEIITAYVSRALTVAEREEFERHLLVCEDCRRDLAEATDLELHQRRRRRMVVGAPLAAAAVLVLAVAGSLGRTGAPTSVFRGQLNEGTARFSALVPEDGGAVGVDSVAFLWQSAGADVHYLLTLTDANGDVVWTTGTSDTTIVLPRSVGLEPDNRYFWYVDALLEGARSSTTGVQEFVVQP